MAMTTTKERAVIVIIICFLAAVGYGAQRNLRFVQKFRVPGSSETVVVSEGDFEPRSTGSYAVSLYGGRSKDFPTDDFVTGVIHTRKKRTSARSVEIDPNATRRD